MEGVSKPIPLLLLPQTVRPSFSSQYPRENPHQRETLPVHRLWSMFWIPELINQAHSKPPHSRRTNAVQMRGLRKDLFQGQEESLPGSPQAAQVGI